MWISVMPILTHFAASAQRDLKACIVRKTLTTVTHIIVNTAALVWTGSMGSPVSVLLAILDGTVGKILVSSSVKY